MADIIKLLPDHVANQIAAGEVVQRPASVVKELMENAIDAGASTIKLVVKDGGKTLIQVIDDGVGMSVTDARLSFERHATSKIQKAEDLFQLNTKGFRGEALASIAAIAHVEMQTRTAEDEVATHIKIEGSKIISQEVTVAPKGTSMMVKNLFFNIPARRNFLKSNNVELRHIMDEFHRVALAHSSINFHFYNNGSELFNLPTSNNRQRIVNIFGAKTNEKLVPVNEDTQVVQISGYISKPEYAKKSRGEQFFFVNNRFIKSPYLHHAILGAFDGLVKKENHPGYFLYLTVDPGSIDINIHPTKTEIKFDDEHTLYAILRSTVKHSLGQFNVIPSLDFEQDQNLETPYSYKDKSAELPRINVDSSFNPFKESSGSGTAQRPTFHKQHTKSWDSLYVGMESNLGKNSGFSSVSFESDTITGSIFENKKELIDTGTTTFQLRRKYVVTTIKSGMVVIDQSRAHQRVLYEKFLKNITIKEAVSQQLLFPLSLTFSKSDCAIIEEIQDSLTTVGFVFDNIGEEEVTVTGVPLSVPESEVGIILDQLISDYQQDFVVDGFSQTDILAKTLAKSLSVKTGEILDSDSQLALVNDLFACKESGVSPFNKPIYVTITEDDIDKKFIQMGRITDAVKHLIIINVLFFVATQLYGDQMYQWFSLWFPKNENFGFWQVISHMFMHGGFMHILFNMYALWAFGSPLERMWGRNKFFFFYFSAGIGAALIHTGVNYYYFNQGMDALINAGIPKEQIMEIITGGKYSPSWYDVASKSTIDNFLGAFNTPAVGASGAIYGVLVAFGMSYPNSELFLMFIPVPVKAKYFIPVLIGLDLFSGVTGYSIFGNGIAHFAHVGGALFGFIMMWYWKKNQFNNNRWDR